MIDLQPSPPCPVRCRPMNYPLTITSRTPTTCFVLCVNCPIEISRIRVTRIPSRCTRSVVTENDIVPFDLPRTNLDLKSRIFSLRLIMQILQTSGPIFRSSEDFLYVIKTYLCVSLSRNGVSSITELFEMALFNFVELLDKFKAHLKIQIEVSTHFHGVSKKE